MTDVAIRDGIVVAIDHEINSKSARVIDATGLIVSPGFIDILSSDRANKHAHTHKITDGVTTTMGMHGGPVDPLAYELTFKESGALKMKAAEDLKKKAAEMLKQKAEEMLKQKAQDAMKQKAEESLQDKAKGMMP